MDKLNVNDPDVFNKWRARYWELTDQEHAEFMEACEAAFPSQQHHDVSRYEHVFKYMQGVSVLEMGGWKGELACFCLNRYNISKWTNIELCQAAANKTVFEDARYEVIVPNRFAWFTAERSRHFDVFVSSHAIEHLHDNHLTQLLDYIAGIPVVFLEAPLQEDGQSWDNDWSTHILTFGWAHIRSMMRKLGYHADKISDSCYMFCETKRLHP